MQTVRREIGEWGPIKNEIVEKYAKTYTKILSKQGWCRTLYVDVFAGSPDNYLRGAEELVPGSAKRAINITPAFNEYLFVDLDRVKVSELESMALSHSSATVLHGDGNDVLRDTVIPRLKAVKGLRALILLDPYGITLGWDVVESLGKTKHAEIILNFPIMDINRNAAHRTTATLNESSRRRMSHWWGDESWKDLMFRQSYTLDLFGQPAAEQKVATNDTIVNAYCERLKSVAEFDYVAPPFPVKNSKNATLYYLVFASPQPVALKIMTEILDKYR